MGGRRGDGSRTWSPPATSPGCRPIDDVRGTAAYRRDAALTLVRRAVAEVTA